MTFSERMRRPSGTTGYDLVARQAGEDELVVASGGQGTPNRASGAPS